MQLFIKINEVLTALNSPQADSLAQSLYSLSIFPVVVNGDTSGFDCLSAADELKEHVVVNSNDLVHSTKTEPINETQKRFLHRRKKRAVTNQEKWVIADRRDLLERFRGIVPILAFTVQEVGQISRLLKALGLENRKLSSFAKQRAVARGRVLFNSPYSNLLRAKARFIIRYDQISLLNF